MNVLLKFVHDSAKLTRKLAMVSRTKAEIEADNQQERMVNDPKGLETFIDLFDQAFRATDNQGVADIASRILTKNGLPAFLQDHEKTLFNVFSAVAPFVPNFSVPFLIRGLKAKASGVVSLGDDFKKKIKGSEHLEFNLNSLGEMILGEAEAEQKTEDDVRLLEDPKVSCISVKASNLYSQVNPLGFKHSVEVIKKRLRPRIRAAMANRPPIESGRQHKLINLDMEEYSDLDITVQVFKDILLEEEFMGYQMGIAIQTYMPDAERVVDDLLVFAKDRVAKGGAPIRIRVVKGANWPMEMIHASENGWKTPTYKDKVDTDANWKKIVKKLLTKQNLAVCHVGVASHNDFDLAYANELLEVHGIKKGAEVEVLEGMANAFRRKMITEFKRKVLVYFPVVKEKNFLTAMAYLVRRFQEQSNESNFLRYVFNVDVDSDAYKMLFERFKNSVRRMSTVSSEPRNKQDRGEEANQLNVEPLCLEFADFKNDHRTNFSLSQNRDWIDGVLERFSGDIHYSVPVKIGGEAVDEDRNLSVVRDRFDVNKRIGEVAIPTRKDIDDMADKAKNDELSKGWATLEQEKVFGIMAKVKAILNQRRGELIGLLASECGKSVVSAEAEICELIDFIGVYAIGAKQTEGYDNVEALNDPKLVGVISPFNFPLAILGGGIVAALMAGNSVIAKPSPKARLIASVLVDIFHAADVPKSVLQLCCAEDEDVPHFVKDLDQCIMTGGTEVALKIRKMNPDMEFFAETGGKNIMYISEFADKEAAIKKVANMSFNGQVCSAPTIIAVPRKLYKDKQFLAQLADAFSSMKVGSPLDPSTKIGPLISNMNQRLLSAYSRPNKKGWLVEPKKIDGRDDMISPGLYIGIPRSEAPKLPETFGPIVDIVCVENVDDYIALVRETGYGLTAGIQTLNPEEIQKFRDKIHAGVLYINEKMTGAEAGRNGYGGFALSRVGKGRQAGWFNYPKNFKRFKNVKPEKAAVKEWYEPRQGDNPKFAQLLQVWGGIVGHNDKIEAEAHLSEADITSLDHVLNNYILKFRDYFGVDEECPDKVLGKRIVHRFKPLGSACIIVDAEVEFNSVMLSMAASYLAGNTTEIYFRNDSLPEPQKRMIALVAHKLGIKIVPGIENDKKYTMMRVLNKADGDALSRHYASAKMHIQVESGESLYEPELEIARYMQEQSEVHAYHRYGDKLRPEDKVIMAGL